MTVKDLIWELLDYELDREVMVFYQPSHCHECGQKQPMVLDDIISFCLNGDAVQINTESTEE